MGWWLRSCEGYYTYSWLHIPIWHMTTERHTCLEYRLCMRMHAQGTVIVWIQWQVTDLCERSYKGSKVFKWKETLVLEGIRGLHNRYIAYLLYFCRYMFSSGTVWLQGSCTDWIQVSGTCCYSFTTIYLTVTYWQWFHHSTSTSGWLDGARIGGCSHLLVVAKEHRGL